MTFSNSITFASLLGSAFDVSVSTGFKGHPTLGPNDCENPSTTAESTLNITLLATDDVAVTHYYASESAGDSSAGDNGWDNYSTSVRYSFDNDTAGTKTVNVWFKDAAGNISENVSISVEYTLLSGGTARRIDVGEVHTCTIKADDTVQCWGADDFGQSSVPSGLGSVKSIVAGYYHTCTIKADDTVQCWGDDIFGQSDIPSGLGSVKSIATGGNHTCAIKADDTVQCWGWDNYGQSSVPSGLGSVKIIFAGYYHTCAIKADDTVQCWGESNEASSVPSGLGSVKSIGAGSYHTCAIKADDTVQCWGTESNEASSVPSGLGSVKSIVAGDYHNCAIKADDTVQCWGWGNYGQSSVPSGLGSVKSIGAGNYHNCAIKADDTVQCWGRNHVGQSTVPEELLETSAEATTEDISDTSAPTAVSVVIDGGAESFTSSAGPTCVHYVAEFSAIAGSFTGNWYSSDALGTPELEQCHTMMTTMTKVPSQLTFLKVMGLVSLEPSILWVML